jgi:carbon storage regulator
MLVLARQINQSIVIGDDIEITIVAIRGDKIRLGISAPKAIPVHRKEVAEAIRIRQQKQTAETSPK